MIRKKCLRIVLPILHSQGSMTHDEILAEIEYDRSENIYRLVTADTTQGLVKRGEKIKIVEQELGDALADGNSIFTCKSVDTAVRHFFKERSCWVSAKTWHPDQAGKWIGAQSQVSFSHSDSRELIMDILQHEPEVEVLRPDTLRTQVRSLHLRAANLH